jgi:hypothetical protein
MATLPERKTAAPPRKPSAVARRISLFERELRVHLSASAIEVLERHARVLSEGQRDGARYFGSTMITFDLTVAVGTIRDGCDEDTARRVAGLLGADIRIKRWATGLAQAHATARAGAPLLQPDIDLRVRSVGAVVHIDLDVEATVT